MADDTMKMSNTELELETEINKASKMETTDRDLEFINAIIKPIESEDLLATTVTATVTNNNSNTSSKTLKRCLSVPLIKTLPGAGSNTRTTTTTMTTRSAAAAAIAAKIDQFQSKLSTAADGFSSNNLAHMIQIPRSNPCSREVSPAPVFNLFSTRTRRYSASCTPLSGGSIAAGSPGMATSPLCITPRVSQLRQEECVDREVNHEREVHTAIQMSQSWEDLTLVAENWSCKSDELSNPLHVILPASATNTSCSSPSPTSTRAGLRLPCVMSPSPTRRTYTTRRSMSPIAMRPSQLGGPVKRKFELDDNNTSSNWNVYSTPPMKKIFTESRGSSPSSICPSPDSGTYDGRITPKLFISKLCTNNNSSSNSNNTNNNNNNSGCSSPISASPLSNSNTTHCSSVASSLSGGSEPMSISNIDEGISISEIDEKMAVVGNVTAATTTASNIIQPMNTDAQDDITSMDDTKSETSSIGGSSCISVESTSCESTNAKVTANFLNKLLIEDQLNSPITRQRNFFINKQGVGGAKKFIVNHDNLQNNNNNNNNKSNGANGGNGSGGGGGCGKLKSPSAANGGRGLAATATAVTNTGTAASGNVIVEQQLL